MESLSVKQGIIAGLLFLSLQAMIAIVYIQADLLHNFLWFCNHSPLLLAIVFFVRRIDLIKGILTVGLLPQLIWSIDFIGGLFVGESLVGITDYMFMSISAFSYISSLAAHILSPIVALLFVYRYPQHKRSLLYSAAYLVGLLVLTLSLTSSSDNFNLVRSISFWNISFPGYTLLWPFLAFALIVLPTHFFLRWIYNKTHNL